MCYIFYESVNSDLRLKDLNGLGVERALLYLKKVAKVDFSSFGAELPIIKGVNLVRNIIVHNGGELPSDSNSKVNKFVSGALHLSGTEGHIVNIHQDFIGHFIEILISFFDKLDVEIQKHIQAYIA